jgi:protein-S-isoprenylcysteine O-methyltransferase Ste14
MAYNISLMERIRKGVYTLTYIKTLLFLLMVPGSVFFLVPAWIVRATPIEKRLNCGFLRTLALVPWLAGAALILSAFWNFAAHDRGTPMPADPPENLVAAGPYRFTRNPQYLGVILILAGHFIWTGVSSLVIYTLACFTAFNVFIIFFEEPNLEQRFGEDYQSYKCQTPRWIPAFRLIRSILRR